MSDLSHTTLLAAPVKVTSSLCTVVPPVTKESVAESVTVPAELIAMASVSEAEPIFPASGITILPPVVKRPPPVIVPPKVALAPLKVRAVVGLLPDLSLSSPPLFVKLPKVVPSSKS